MIGLLAEFDALPDLSQTADPHKASEPSMVNGHACSHDLFGSVSVAAAIAVRRWMDASGIKGEVRLYESPLDYRKAGQ